MRGNQILVTDSDAKDHKLVETGWKGGILYGNISVQEEILEFLMTDRQNKQSSVLTTFTTNLNLVIHVTMTTKGSCINILSDTDH